MVEVLRNEEKQGIELYFDSKPIQEIINKLKEAKFRWHNVKKCWYAKENEYTLKIANDISEGKEIGTAKVESKETLKSLRIITDYNEFRELYCKSNNYVVGEDYAEKMASYFYKKELMILTEDNYIMLINKKPSIDSTLWYDDETEKPNKTENYFISYNMSMNWKFKILEDYFKNKKQLEEKGCAIGGYDYNGLYFVKYNNSNMVNYDFHDLDRYTNKDYFIRYMSKEEQEDFLQIVKKLNDDYIDRLKKYYKRYNDKISICGYWANR